MRHVGVGISREKDRQYRVYFEENDVRRACRMLPCSHHSDSCIRRMQRRATTCELCFAVLTALKKDPVKTKVCR